MGHRRSHYDCAFHHYLQQQDVSCLAVDEARRALLKDSRIPRTLKSFDFVVYSPKGNLLVDVKGRKHSGRSKKSLENWVTEGDVTCLAQWERLFGADFRAAFVFLYWCQAEPPDALFQETFEVSGRWYSVLTIDLSQYLSHMRRRSASWQTWCMGAEDFRKLARPLREVI